MVALQEIRRSEHGSIKTCYNLYESGPHVRTGNAGSCYMVQENETEF